MRNERIHYGGVHRQTDNVGRNSDDDNRIHRERFTEGYDRGQFQ